MSTFADLLALDLAGAEVVLTGDLNEQPEMASPGTVRRVQHCTVNDEGVVFGFGLRPDGQPDELMITQNAEVVSGPGVGAARVIVPYMGIVHVRPAA